MRILFVTFRTHVPDATGGAQRSIHELLAAAAGRGHTCAAVSLLDGGVRLTAFRLFRRLTKRRWTAWIDRRAGYPVWRTWDPLLEHASLRVAAAWRPEVVVLDADPRTRPIVEELVTQGVPVVLRFVDVTVLPNPAAVPRSRLVTLLANSEFVAKRIGNILGRTVDVVPPVVIPGEYAVDRASAGAVTFINPRPIKGLELALAVAARLPHRRFLFVESWPLPREQWRDLQARVASYPNVALRRRARDVKSVYADTQVLIVPSLCEEAFGRVVLEAHASGIPVIARDAGGLPEALGEGGDLMARDDGPDAWAAAVERLLIDAAHYRDVSRAALNNVRRPDLQPDAIVERFLALLEQHAFAGRGT